MKALLIDDEPLARATVRRFLEREGYEVIEAENGAVGLKLSGDPEIAVVVTDIVMPEREGLEVIKELASTRPGLPVIAITGGGGDASRAVSYIEWAEIIGAKAVLQKPFTREDLATAIRKATR
ncbi:MAG: response regulator [Rhodospirillales bacterium]